MIDDKLINEIKQIERATSKIYGVKWNKTADPMMTRTDDAVGMVANVGTDNQVVSNDFDSAQIYREMQEIFDLYGNKFIRIPKFYIFKESTPEYLIKKVSRYQHEGFYLPAIFWDFENQRELPYFDYGVHNASLSLDNKLQSKPDEYPLVSRNIVQFRDYARSNNTNGLKGYQQLDVHAYDVLTTLYHIEFATLDSQAVMRGFTAGRYTATDVATVAEKSTNRIIVSKANASQFRIGQSIGIGTSQGGNQIASYRTIIDIVDYDASNSAIMFNGASVDIAVGNMVYNVGWKSGFGERIRASSGSIVNNTDGKYPCKYRGIENPFGNIWQFVDGINTSNNQAWVNKNANEYASNAFVHPYEQLSYVNHNVNGYTREMGFDENLPFAEFPVYISGASASTYYSDYYYQSTGARIALVGGCWADGSNAGISYWALVHSSANASVYFGGRLLKKAL